ncbi:hypothetical protein G3I44_14365 [Halogeometricum borinquense]|uniref:Uncharacterized protein n=1 Tax=Halogeometricum borinquense TaxID=60847 RepID=A0A6C0UJK7_9EURY|nr:hypothetical protein [Halogeometricum borinquense]QIB75370.1 hypothetical protein G3I44_14365 [Halogeometricum borinquense]
MASADRGTDNRLRFRSLEEIRTGRAETELKHRYGRGIYVNEIHEASNEDLVISLGNTVPKDVSDSLEQDRVLQFINIRDIYTLRAEATGEGVYIVDLPDRDEVHDGFLQRRQQIIDRLDWSMAKAIYEHVFELTPVENQLNAIIQLVRWIHEESSIPLERLKDAQGSGNTEEYVQVLSDLGFLAMEGEDVAEGEKMQETQLLELDNDQYVKTVVGNIVKDGYNVLQDRLELRMLRHYPKFCNAYYYDALQRQDPGLHLDVDAVTRNYQRQYGEDIDSFVVNDKLNELAETEVIRKDGEYVQSNPDVYRQVSQEAQVY